VRLPDVVLGSWTSRCGGRADALEIWAYFVIAIPSVLLIFFLFTSRSRPQQQPQVTVEKVEPAPESPAVTEIRESAIAILSGRVAALEGTLTQISASLGLVAVLEQRIASIEVNLPSMQEALTKYYDVIDRADKRSTERVRKQGVMQERERTAGETASDMLDGVGATGGNPAATQPAPSQNDNGRRAGVVGSGGRNRQRGAG